MKLDPSWHVRRALIVATGIGCAAMIWRAMSGGLDAGVATTAIVSASGLWGSTLGSYVFGVIWHEKNQKGAG